MSASTALRSAVLAPLVKAHALAMPAALWCTVLNCMASFPGEFRAGKATPMCMPGSHLTEAGFWLTH
uniref:Secreted protein n=1 Tax=Anopheles darlingi TaxID=43151 RepID=A0A2M4D7J9_ANODA